MEGLRPDLPSMAERGEIRTLHAEVFELRRANEILEFAEPHRERPACKRCRRVRPGYERARAGTHPSEPDPLMALATEVAPGVHRVADGLVNWYLIVDGGEVAMVDAGWPRSWSQVEAALTEIGRSPADVRSVVLTHAHPDHLGAAEAVRERCGATVHVYRDEVDRARGKAKGSSPFTLVPGLAPHLWRPSAFGFVMHATVRGFMMPTWVTEVESFGSDAPIDAPGRLRAVPTPGHTEGHVALVLEEHGVVFSGDSIATLDVLTRARGARLLSDALNGDPAQTRESLTALGAIDAGLVLPGHGEPFEGTPASAVERARDVDDGGERA